MFGGVGCCNTNCLEGEKLVTLGQYPDDGTDSGQTSRTLDSALINAHVPANPLSIITLGASGLFTSRTSARWELRPVLQVLSRPPSMDTGEWPARGAATGHQPVQKGV